jgi:glycosyltransferase involved in cell wall biosynthesis
MHGFSVIMPTYNQCTFIRRAIKSLCNQTYKNWELIIVNDGCIDNTEEFIADYLTSQKYNVRYIKNETNEGIGFSINKAMEIAQYNYLIQVYHPHKKIKISEKKMKKSGDN